MLMIVFAFASCKKGDETNGDGTSDATQNSLEKAVFSNIANSAESTLKNVATSMKEIPELEGFSPNTEVNVWDGDMYYGRYRYDRLSTDSEFIVFSKRAEDTEKVTYKIFSVRAAKVIQGFTDTENLMHEFFFNYETPTFVVKTTKVIVENQTAIRIETDTMYDASGAVVPANVGTDTLEAKMLYDKVIIHKNIYEVDAAGKLTSIDVIEGNLDISESATEYDGNRYYVRTSDGFAVYDSKCNYVAEWFKPTNTKSYSFFALNDGNVLVQYRVALHPSVTEYDIYEGDSESSMVKYDIVTEVFNITDKKSTAINFDGYLDFAQSNASLKFEKSVGNNKDETTLVGDFENYAMIYPIQKKKVNYTEGAKSIVLMSNDGTVTKDIKLVDNQTGIPEKYTEELYRVETTYGYAIADASGNVIKQISGTDTVERVGDYLVDAAGIYSLKYESVHNFNANNSVKVGIIDNTVFVKKYASADRAGDYTIYAYSKGEPREVCKYVKEKASTSPEFVLYEDLSIYAIYNRETKLCTYYNADGKVEGFLKDSKILLDSKDVVNGSIISYRGEFVTELGSSIVTKYIAISGNFYE